MLGPGKLVQTLDWVLEPNELSTTVLSIAAGSQEVQAAITIDIDPLTGMVEVATLES